MASVEEVLDKLQFKPATMDEWEDLQQLFAQDHPYGGCWCMYWRIKRSEFEKQYGEGNENSLKQIIASGQVPGILAYLDGRPIGWCAIAPREAFPVLDRSRTLKRVDERPVWSIVCFFVAKPFRGRGLMRLLIDAAIEYASANGAQIVEAYPLIPEKSKSPALGVYMGLVTVFEKAGFKEVIRRSEMRPVMRYFVKER